MKHAIRSIARFVRRLHGTDLINARLRQLEKAQAEHSERLGAIINALAALSLPREEVEKSALYQQAREIVAMLSPMDVEGGAFVRIGRNNDGGYVMLEPQDLPRPTVAYSFGVAEDVSWELDIARRDIDVRLFDHTITGLPKSHPRFRFSRVGITGGNAGNGLETLPELLSRDGNSGRSGMLLKMDVEGCEWGVLETCPSTVLACFDQIVMEFHDVGQMLSRNQFTLIETALTNLSATHQCIHVHANVYTSALILPGCVLPSAFECTFVNRHTYRDRLRPGTRAFPTALDQSCDPRLSDLVLGRFNVTGTAEA